MSLFGAMLSANQRLQSELRSMDKKLPRRRRPPLTLSSEPPRAFALYVDPLNRFHLRYPKDWSLADTNGVQVTSSRLGTFVSVEVVPEGIDPWARLKEDVRKKNGVLRSFNSTDKSASGILEVGAFVFQWEARQFPGGVVLATGNVVDSRRSKSVETYEDSVLAAIRRHFKVTSSR